MNIERITMDRGVAKTHYENYRASVRQHRVERRQKLAATGQEIGDQIARARIEKTRLEREDEELEAAYKALAKGNPIINLPSVLRAAGAQPETFYPALALARADWKDCFFRIRHELAWFSEEALSWRARAHAPGPKAIHVRQDVFPRETWDYRVRGKLGLTADYSIKALVPSIPAHLRPANLEKYFILWDAAWTPAPPVDPLLLKRISPALFVVVAQWDLTDLERSILEGRIGQ